MRFLKKASIEDILGTNRESVTIHYKEIELFTTQKDINAFIDSNDDLVDNIVSNLHENSRNKLSIIKERVEIKINEYMNELAQNDELEDSVEALDRKENIKSALKKLEEKNTYYDKINDLLDENEVNEINLTDLDARTVKFGSHQGTDVGYNIQTVVDAKQKLIIDYDVINNSTDHG